ncbi:MAG: cytidine deaminase [Bacillota bacterium]
MTVEQRNKLISAAKSARENSYAPYSKFKVGAALLTKSGEIFTGCNVENASYTATICAERVALAKAVSEGFKQFLAIAIITEKSAFPCGICLQSLAEFANDFEVITCDIDFKYEIYELKELLPHGFKLI